MRSLTGVLRPATALLVALLASGCVEGEPAPTPTPSPQAAATGTVVDDVHALLMACQDNVTPPAEAALGAARRSEGVADAHEASPGDDPGDATPATTRETARREARRAARLATEAVAACLQQAADLATDTGPTPDRRAALMQERLRDLGRALSDLERSLQADASVHESADALAAAITRWRRLVRTSRPAESDTS